MLSPRLTSRLFLLVLLGQLYCSCAMLKMLQTLRSTRTFSRSLGSSSYSWIGSGSASRLFSTSPTVTEGGRSSTRTSRIRVKRTLLAQAAIAPPTDTVDPSDDENLSRSSQYAVPDVDESTNEFSRLGLLSDVVKGLASQGFVQPTPVQRAVIPRLLGGESLVMAASTGSGKTFAFALPAVQSLIAQEADGYTRQPRRPRCVILVPTRELARQILAAIKSLSHFSIVSSCAVLGGEQYAIQKKQLDRLVDVVVASPGRLMQHKEQGNVFFSQVTHVIIDEVDTMLTQGFGSDIRAILRSAVKVRPDAVVVDDIAGACLLLLQLLPLLPLLLPRHCHFHYCYFLSLVDLSTVTSHVLNYELPTVIPIWMFAMLI